jgi:hypothetical protein
MAEQLAPHYSFARFPFMRPQGPAMPVTEASVCVPPALWVRDSENALWTLGFDYSETEWRCGRWEYDVVRDGCITGAFARVIEYAIDSRGNKVVRIFGADGWRTWNGRQFV